MRVERARSPVAAELSAVMAMDVLVIGRERVIT